jgi:hypothetical protein
MRKTLFTCAAIGALVLAAFPVQAKEQKQAPADPPVLVIPARYAFVKAAMDIEAVRPIPIVCYGVGTNAMALNRWNAAAKAWDPITMDNLKSGAGLGKPPLAAVMGTDVAAVASLAEVTKDWAGKAVQIPSCDLAALVNALSGPLHFTSSEWQWLAGRFNLQLKDENEQRRRYGRYGPPDQKKKAPPAPKASGSSDVVMPKAAAPEAASAAGEPPREKSVEAPAVKSAAPEIKAAGQAPASAAGKPDDTPAQSAANK